MPPPGSRSTSGLVWLWSLPPPGSRSTSGLVWCLRQAPGLRLALCDASARLQVYVWPCVTLIFASARLQVYVWPCVTLIFDIWIPKVDHFMSLCCASLMPIYIKLASMFFKILSSQVSNCMYGWTNGQAANTMHPPVSEASWTHVTEASRGITHDSVRPRRHTTVGIETLKLNS